MIKVKRYSLEPLGLIETLTVCPSLTIDLTFAGGYWKFQGRLMEGSNLMAEFTMSIGLCLTLADSR